MRTLIASTALVALLAAPAVAQTGSGAQGTGQFCLKTMAGKANCAYQTMAQCEQARPAGSSDQCVDKSQVGGTTGSGAGSPSGSPMPPAGSPPSAPK